MTEDRKQHTDESVGARLARLRRAQNITQEELAERLGISRQAVSKWESDLAYPETDKLVSLAHLYHCTVDYLLTGQSLTGQLLTGQSPTGQRPTEEEPASAQAENSESSPSESPNLWERIERGWGKRPRYFEYKSRRTVRGVPLVHVNIGFGRKAKGIVAIGLTARGILSIGLASVGVLSFGLCSVGLLSVGALALGLLLAVGSMAMGTVAIGAIAAGIFAIGALSVGLISIGALSAGYFLAVGDHAYGMIALGQSLARGEVLAIENLTASDLPEILPLIDRHLPALLQGIGKVILRGMV